jgi:hypothetical protein
LFRPLCPSGLRGESCFSLFDCGSVAPGCAGKNI